MPGIPVNTNIALDVTVGAWMHNFLAPIPTPPPPAPVFAIEIPATQMWTLGYLTKKNVFTESVKHRFNLPIVLEGHDLGMMIPDITIPFVNAWYAIMWPFSSRKINFTTSIVKMDGKMVGCADIVPPLPMLSCGDPCAFVLTFPVTNKFLDSVQVGITLLDILLGLCAALFSIALDVLFWGIGLRGGAKPPSPIMEQLAMAFLGKLVPTSGADLAKLLLSGFSGVFIVPPGGQPSYKISLGWGGVDETQLEITGSGVTVQRNLLGRTAVEAGLGGESGSRLEVGGERVLGRTDAPPGGESGGEPQGGGGL